MVLRGIELGIVIFSVTIFEGILGLIELRCLGNVCVGIFVIED